MHTIKQSHVSHQANNFRLPYADALGIAASTLCLIHCLVLPFVVMLLPALGANFVHDDRTHYFLAFFVTAFCLMGIVPGYLRHSRRQVLLLMLSGLTMVLFATFASAHLMGEMWEIPLITAGNLMVVGAHLTNRRLLSCC